MTTTVAAMALANILLGCSMFGAQKRGVDLGPDERVARIEALRDAIERDHADLATLVTEPQEEASDVLEQYPQFEPIARRLGAHEQELARLEALDREETQ